jgi:hypothetical protein
MTRKLATSMEAASFMTNAKLALELLALEFAGPGVR